MNKVILIGNVVAEPEFRTTQSGISQCTVRIAVQRRFANQQGVREADFFNVIAWRNSADFASRYFHKGTRIVVEGSIQNRSYDAQDGSKRYVTEIIADNFEFAGPRQEGGSAPRTDNPPPPTEPPANFGANAPAGFTEVDDDELPF
ncbi:MAG: single-stranded DNA-binding protein [Clostridiales bacterium]|nr:single-stranded DNA-binding protein [Clostridiales bacterium]